MVYDNIDTSLKEQFLKFFREQREDRVAAITRSVVEDYPVHVGYLQALEVIQAETVKIIDAYFPR